MSEEPTSNISRRFFEDEVLSSLRSLNSRLQSLEDEAARRALDTKAIWERTLAGIEDVKLELGAVKSHLGSELGAVKSQLAEVKADLGVVKAEICEVKADLRDVKADIRDVKS